MDFIRKNKSNIPNLNQIWIYKTLVKTLTCILIKKTPFILYNIWNKEIDL